MSLRAILTPKLALSLGTVALAGGALAACGDGGRAASTGGGPSVVVTTSVLGDVVENLVGDQAAVEVLMPRGADPHEAELSSRQADAMSRADLVVTNGAHFEQGMERVIDSVEADGTPVFTVADHVELLTFADEHERQEAAARAAQVPGDDEHDADPAAGGAEGEGDRLAGGDGHGHDEDDVDPHLWTDPRRMAEGTRALAERLAGLDGIDAATLGRATDAYLAELAALDAEVEQALAPLPEADRVLVTNHEAFGYFADRYGFRVMGAVIPAGTTQAEPSSSDITRLATVIRETGVPAIFAETSSPAALARALAEDAGDVEVVELFSESLGDEGSGGATYVEMMRTNAARIAEALA